MDNGSAFTGELAGCLEECGARPERARPGRAGPDAVRRHGSFVLSGRRRPDRRANAANAAVVRHAVSEGKPVLGVCYGAEIMALALGGTLRRMDAPRRGEARVRARGSRLLPGGEATVFESHAYEIARPGPVLEAAGSSDGCGIEIVEARGAPAFGVQFHPEMTADGRAMIGRFVRACDRY